MSGWQYRKLVVTDGTVSDAGIPADVDLISASSVTGIHLREWEPKESALKGGGTWADSALANGRRLSIGRNENVQESLVIDVVGHDTDDLIRYMRILRAMLQKARNFWLAGWNIDEPVWIEGILPQETNAWYSVVMDYQIPSDRDLMSKNLCSVSGKLVFKGVDLIIEREPFWRAEEPQTGTSTAIGVKQEFEGRDFGNVDSVGDIDPKTTEEMFIANHWKEANLTNLYEDDGGVWTALDGAALPFRLFPVAPAANDAFYIGLDGALVDDAPFCSLVFDLATGTAASGFDLVWEYFNGAWVALTIQDNTAGDGGPLGTTLDTVGVHSINWDYPTDWQQRALNLDGGPAVTGFFVRCRVTAAVGPFTVPQQQNRRIYTVSWPYIELQNSAVLGDVIAKTRFRVRSQVDKVAATAIDAWTSRLIAGVRSVDRGDEFVAFVNYQAAGVNMPTDVQATAVAPGVLTTLVTSPSYRVLRCTNPGANAQVCEHAFSNPEDWTGRYHMYLRGKQTSGASGDMEVWFKFLVGNVTDFETEKVSFRQTTDIEVLDLGVVEITGKVSTTFPALILYVETWIDGDGAADCDLYDFILMPVDEYAFDVVDLSDISRGGGTAGRDQADGGTIIYVDGVENVKTYFAGSVVQLYGTIQDLMLMITAENPLVPSQERVRIWFLAIRRTTGSSVDRSAGHMCATVMVKMVQQYLSMRGAS